MGEGRLDFSEDNANELVNPSQSVWKWKTMAQFVAETYAKGGLTN